MGAGPSRSRQAGSRRAATRRAARFAALLALLLQAFIVQAHVHPAALALGGGVERMQDVDDAAAHAEASAPEAHAFGCPICEALASNSLALGEAASSVHAERARSESATLAIAQAPRAHTHAWRSRAPPSRLSA